MFALILIVCFLLLVILAWCLLLQPRRNQSNPAQAWEKTDQCQYQGDDAENKSGRAGRRTAAAGRRGRRIRSIHHDVIL